MRPFIRGVVTAAALASSFWTAAAVAQAWEPTRPVQFIVPAGTGGGADTMARAIQGIIGKNNLMKQPVQVVNKGGAAGGEGFLDVKASAGDPHKIIITLSNLFTTPLGAGVPFNWKDLTPVAMLALDEFVLWVPADAPYKTAGEYLAAIKAGGNNKFKMGGTGSKQEDQIITVAVEKAAGAKLTYVPFGGGGEVATQLVGKHIDSTVNNPIEAIAHWRSGALKPLCVFDAARLAGTDKVTATMAWKDIPTCKEGGLDVQYLMLRGIFTTPGATPAQVAFYVELLRKVREAPEWQQLMRDGAFNTRFMTGTEYTAWLTTEEARHRNLMREAGFLAGN